MIILVSATADEDYTSLPRWWTWNSGRLTFSSSDTRQCVSIATASDYTLENTEIFFVQMGSVYSLPPFVELTRTTATIFIQDDDGMIASLPGPRLFRQLCVIENDAGLGMRLGLI